MARAPVRRARTIDLALPIPSWESRPANLKELAALMNRLGVSNVRRGAIASAWSRGTASLFVEDRMLFATRHAVLPREWLMRQFGAALDVVRPDFRSLASSLISGRISLPEFQALAAGEIVTAIQEASYALFGPNLADMPAIREVTRQLAAQQVNYLNRMVNEIVLGQQKMDGSLLRRYGMYAGSAWGAMQELSRWLARGEGWQYEENVLSDADHCGGCVEQTALGRVPIGTLVPVGQRDCLSNCKCFLRYS